MTSVRTICILCIILAAIPIPVGAQDSIEPSEGLKHIGQEVRVTFVVRGLGNNGIFQELYSETSWDAPDCFFVRLPPATLRTLLKPFAGGAVGFFNERSVQVVGTIVELQFDNIRRSCIVVDSVDFIRIDPERNGAVPTPENLLERSQDALNEIREDQGWSSLLNPMDLFKYESGALIASLDEELVEILQPNEIQREMLRELGEQLAANRTTKKELQLKYPFYSAERDKPEVTQQFNAINRTFVEISRTLNERLAPTITDEKRLQLNIHRHGLTAIFFPNVQHRVGLDDRQLLSLALDWKESDDEEQRTTDELGDAIFNDPGAVAIARWHRYNPHVKFWCRLSAEQARLLKELGVEMWSYVPTISWIPTQNVLADCVSVKLNLRSQPVPASKRNVVVIRGIVDLAGQKEEVTDSANGRCQLVNVMLQRRKSLSETEWSHWLDVPVETVGKILADSEGISQSSLHSSNANPVITAPSPALLEGSWESVDSHPDLTADSGKVMLRFPDFTLSTGGTFQYRCLLQWAFVKSGVKKPYIVWTAPSDAASVTVPE